MGTPTLNTVYWTADRSDDLSGKMTRHRRGSKAGDVIAFGHTHIPWHRVVDEVHWLRQHWLEWAGPRTATGARATCCSKPRHTAQPRVEVVRVAYDVDAAARDAVNAGLPVDFAEFLRSGGAVQAAEGAIQRRRVGSCAPTAGSERGCRSWDAGTGSASGCREAARPGSPH